MLIPFGLFGKTAFLAERVLGNVISSGIKVLVLAVIIGIGSTLFCQFTAGFGGNTPTIDDAMAIVLAALSLLGLGIFGPGIANGLVSGGPQLGAGAAVGTGLAAGGMALRAPRPPAPSRPAARLSAAVLRRRPVAARRSRAAHRPPTVSALPAGWRCRRRLRSRRCRRRRRPGRHLAAEARGQQCGGSIEAQLPVRRSRCLRDDGRIVHRWHDRRERRRSRLRSRRVLRRRQPARLGASA